MSVTRSTSNAKDSRKGAASADSRAGKYLASPARMQSSSSLQSASSRRVSNHGLIAQDALRTALATEEIGITTLTKLRTQTEQLNRIEDHVAETDEMLTASARTIRSMKSVSGRLWNWVSKANPKSDIEARRAHEKKKTPVKEPSRRYDVPTSSTKQALEGDSSRDVQLDALSDSVRKLHLIAQDMNSELTVQGRMLDGIDNDMNSLQERLKMQNRQIRKL
uniref:t-SNARE coiled-coil homology domain-containing protein n=1 Tax=Spongospora subterranea TaxID=70186 RepID=A0A0H5R8Y0_9EUKA|eukprot:CRZ10583.1 hypothetical protein [Spongospora subterranea]